MRLPQPPPARGQGVKLLVEAVAEGEAADGAADGEPGQRVSELGGGESTRVSSCIFEKGRERITAL